MITGLKDKTAELSNDEKRYQALLIPLLENSSKKHPFTNDALRAVIKRQTEVSVRPDRIRKMIHNIRVTGAVKCLLADNRGYYVSKDRGEVTRYRQSLRERIQSIDEVAVAISLQLDELSPNLGFNFEGE